VRLNPGISGLKNFRDPGIAIPNTECMRVRRPMIVGKVALYTYTTLHKVGYM